MSGWDQEYDIESLADDMKSADWTHNICERCWAERYPGKWPVRVTGYDQATTCCFCRYPTWAGIHIREDPARFTECAHNTILTPKPK